MQRGWCWWWLCTPRGVLCWYPRWYLPRACPELSVFCIPVSPHLSHFSNFSPPNISYSPSSANRWIPFALWCWAAALSAGTFPWSSSHTHLLPALQQLEQPCCPWDSFVLLNTLYPQWNFPLMFSFLPLQLQHQCWPSCRTPNAVPTVPRSPHRHQLADLHDFSRSQQQHTGTKVGSNLHTCMSRVREGDWCETAGHGEEGWWAGCWAWTFLEELRVSCSCYTAEGVQAVQVYYGFIYILAWIHILLLRFKGCRKNTFFFPWMRSSMCSSIPTSTKWFFTKQKKKKNVGFTLVL